MSLTDIPMPQDTKLYEASNNQILEPRISVQSLSFSEANGGYTNTKQKEYIWTFYNQKCHQYNTGFNNIDIASTRGATYYNLNGFDYGFKYRLLNKQSPTVSFLPLIKATDSDYYGAPTNVNLVNLGGNSYQVNQYTVFLSNTLEINDLLLLRNQTNAAENKVYRVTNVQGVLLTIYDDSSDSYDTTGIASINEALTQNQDYIFTRAKVVDRYGTAYYGLYYDGSNKYWVSQTLGLNLQYCDYGISFASELVAYEINFSVFSAKNVYPAVGETIAINITTNGSGSLGGKTTGIYSIVRIANAKVYFVPIYPSYVFIHQFVKVGYDLDTLSANAVWFVNPQTTTSENYLYGSVNFNFNKFELSSAVTQDPTYWGIQVGGASDTPLGFEIYTNTTANNYILNSDSFSFSLYIPTWASYEIIGHSLNINYSLNEQTFEVTN